MIKTGLIFSINMSPVVFEFRNLSVHDVFPFIISHKNGIRMLVLKVGIQVVLAQ